MEQGKHVRDILLITTLRWLAIDAPPGIYKLMPTVSLVVGKENIKRHLPSNFDLFAGIIESNYFDSANHLVVCDAEDLDNWGADFSADEILHMWLVFVEWALQDSWLVKDNCFVCEIAYCRLKELGAVSWANNNLYAQASTTHGFRDVIVQFDRAELELWASKGVLLRSRLHETGYSFVKPVTDRGVTRFARFLSFVYIARCASLPAMKISQMCSALESLFSTTTTELTHRLSERVSFFIGGSPVEMESNYQFMKKVYAVRSQVTHGAPVSKSLAGEIPSLSETMLDLLRVITFKILEDDDAGAVVAGSDEFIESHFRKCLFFGVQQPIPKD